METSMYTISKEFKFEAAHQLTGLPNTHPCSRVHGHSYTVIVEIKGQVLNEPGFVIDYRALEPIKHFIDTELDHRNLNDVLGNVNPTAENIAANLFYRFRTDMAHIFQTKNCRVSAVTVKETEKTAARYEQY